MISQEISLISAAYNREQIWSAAHDVVHTATTCRPPCAVMARAFWTCPHPPSLPFTTADTTLPASPLLSTVNADSAVITIRPLQHQRSRHNATKCAWHSGPLWALLQQLRNRVPPVGIAGEAVALCFAGGQCVWTGTTVVPRRQPCYWVTSTVGCRCVVPVPDTPPQQDHKTLRRPKRRPFTPHSGCRTVGQEGTCIGCTGGHGGQRRADSGGRVPLPSGSHVRGCGSTARATAGDGRRPGAAGGTHGGHGRSGDASGDDTWR